MQVFGLVGFIALVALVWLSGFQIVPNSDTNKAAAGESGVSTGWTAPTFTRSTPDTTAAVNEQAEWVREPQPIFTPAAINIKSAQNVEVNTALLRGEILTGTETLNNAFFIYSYDKTALEKSIATQKTYATVLGNKESNVSLTRVASNVARDKEFATRVTDLAPDSTYYVRLCVERAGTLSCSYSTSFRTIPGAFRPGDVRTPTVRITDETADSADELILSVKVAMRDTVDGDVYLIYGESQAKVEDASDESYSRIDEDDELIQKKRIARTIRGTQQLRVVVDDLEDDTKHYYIVCVEYDGLRDGTLCTRTQTYTTYDEDYGKAPRVQTGQIAFAGSIARLTGSISMRDFNNGKVFFVYGTDFGRISKIQGEISMERIRQTQDRLQRILVDKDLDGNDSYVQMVQDLLPATSYAARLCVEYKNQNDNYRDVTFVACGDLQSFLTK